FVSLAVFLVFEVIPGDPVLTILGPDAEPALIAQLQEQLGTNLPLGQRLIRWAGGVVTGDLGMSIRFTRTVSSLIFDRVIISLMIAVVALSIVVVVAVPAGVFLALYRKHWAEPLVSTGIQVGMAIPSFWLGIILISVFGLILRWFPTGGFVYPHENLFQSLRSVALPSIAIALPQIAVVVRYTRNAVLDQMHQDYVRTARSKGLRPRRVIFAHVLRNAALPVITVLGLIFSNVVAGTIVIEQVFALPGLGMLLVQAVSTRDFPLIQGLVLYITFSVAFFNLVVDLVYQMIDPRIELS
ncbi:MAG: ABC transporter permease, partial [Spirochaetales bacterium]|nr:ABC transporter permease [Spirochaetales bacterium]